MHCFDVTLQLPVLTHLRNPCLKPRHWSEIEQVLEYEFTADDPISLRKLEEIEAFERTEEIEEISGKASSEASLEAILKKVEEAWKTMEFMVLPYKDQKDVFILGGTDDIQVLLDDSNINIQTIASSRHVGPIKPRVEEWVRQLELFGKTLVSACRVSRSGSANSNFSVKTRVRISLVNTRSFSSHDGRKFYFIRRVVGVSCIFL